jgi:hypothetical protein
MVVRYHDIFNQNALIFKRVYTCFTIELSYDRVFFLINLFVILFT